MYLPVLVSSSQKSVENLFCKARRCVPYWNYFLLRSQIFMLYFVAGIQKMDKDWMGGYSMEHTSSHWIFDLFRNFLTEEQIDYYLIHWGGFLIDSTAGFMLIINSTRPLAFLFCGIFHLMNSQMFSIGMFSYVMLATMPLFASPSWPRNIVNIAFKKCSTWSSSSSVRNLKKTHELDLNSFEQSTNHRNSCRKPCEADGSQSTRRQKTTTILICIYLSTQCFLPFSHWLTPGYNTWTKGIYGYSWDMMVHNWRYVHTKIQIFDKTNGNNVFLDPDVWSQSWRWTHHADMVKQFAECVQEKLEYHHNYSNIELYIDVWLSLNGRFSQRVYDPTVNILEAKWSPFHKVNWVLPLLTEFTEWRDRLREIEKHLIESHEKDVVFVADFPGLSLTNFVDEDLRNTTITVLKGDVNVLFPGKRSKLKVTEGQSIELPSGSFHQVVPSSPRPVCYMYTFENATFKALDSAWNERRTPTAPLFWGQSKWQERADTYFRYKEQEELRSNSSILDMYREVMRRKYNMWIRSSKMMIKAIESIVRGMPMDVKLEDLRPDKIL